jgi:hypothetical protein
VTAPTKEDLEAAHCWEAEDVIPSRPEMTAFRQASRYHQARWREANGHPVGTQPIAPKPGDEKVRFVGSRLPLSYARDTGANFLTPSALAAARARSATVERHQTFDRQRLWADLLWSPTLAFNLFGDLADDRSQADRAIHTWFPDAPGRVSDVRFAHSPGRLDREYLNSLRSFAAAFVLERDDGTHGVVAVDVKYHERNKPEIPRPENLSRYVEVAQRSDAFGPDAIDTLKQRGDLCVMWLEHLLMHAMLQHRSGEWTWGRYVVVHPSRNTDAVDATSRYRALLADDSTFATMTLEDLLGSGTLPTAATAALRDRYLVD